MAGIGLARLLDVCCGSARRRSCIPIGDQTEEGATRHDHGAPCDDDEDAQRQERQERGASGSADAPQVRALSAIIGEMEQGLAVVERTLAGDGESSSRVRENDRRELAREHPGVPASEVAKACMEVGGVGVEREKEKEAIANESRAGRYKKKRFV